MGGTQMPGGITFLCSAGDSGAYGYDFNFNIVPEPNYPASSPYVVSVGGTALTASGTNPNYTYGSETAWGYDVNSFFEGGGGGGVSTLERQPPYQAGKVTTYSTTYRAYPDVSMEAAPTDPSVNFVGVPVYDSFDNADPTGSWINGVGGTSLSSPMWAGLIAITDEGRAIAGLGSLYGAHTDLARKLYSLPSADFHDVTKGSTGPSPEFDAGVGYDLTTGLGSPVANKLIPGLVNYLPAVTNISPTTGISTGGTVVTITGTNFNGGTIVNFGNTPATNVTVVSSTQITATSPAGTGTVDVTVTGPGGTSAISTADQFTYSLVPVVTAVSPPAAPLAGGTTVTITGINFTGATTVDFGSTAGTNVVVKSATQITVTAPAGTGTVDITVITPNGTSPTSSADQFTYEGAPTISSISPPSGQFGGRHYRDNHFRAQNLAGLPTLVNFGTKAATIKSSSATKIVVTSPAGTGTVDVTVTDPGGTSAKTVVDQFIYAAPPTVATAASATPSPVTGLTTNLSVLGADVFGESTLTYTWAATTVPNGATAPTFSVNGTNAAKISTATFSKAGGYLFTVTITDVGGQKVTSSVSLTVNQTFTAISVLPANQFIYVSQSQQFTATALDQFGAAMAAQPTFTWSVASGVGTISSSGLFSSPSASGTATISAASGSVSGTTGITVLSQTPAISTAASATPSPVTGKTTNLSVTATDQLGPSTLTYSWAPTSIPNGATAPTFSANNSNAAQNTTATFTQAAGELANSP